jgi:hypothetical protein
MRFDGDVTVDAIRSSIHHFENVDDVFSRTFLSLIIFELSPGATKELSSEVNKFLHSLGTQFIGILDERSQNADRGLPDPGPYFASPKGSSEFGSFIQTLSALLCFLQCPQLEMQTSECLQVLLKTLTNST